jgi:hypothetical protein
LAHTPPATTPIKISPQKRVFTNNPGGSKSGSAEFLSPVTGAGFSGFVPSNREFFAEGDDDADFVTTG